MATKDYGSLTKEFPLSSVDKTIEAITPGMHYSDLLTYAKKETEAAVPGLIRKRFLSVDDLDRIIYDEFLALIKREGISSKVARKVMLFTWAYRDQRLRRFIVERVANTNGKWSATKLTNKANADFFEHSGGTKARSNIEYFLTESGIYNQTTRQVHLELDDNWLEEAARVAAQHERAPEVRRHLLKNPYRFLADRGWQALANSTVEELTSREPEANYDAEPDEDSRIPTDPKKRGRSKPWSRNKPNSIDKASTQALIDIVARERANQSHHSIEEALAAKIKEKGLEPWYNHNIDIFFSCDEGSVIVEIKSCNENNIHAQVRKGVSQLLEYRYIYSDAMTLPVYLALALEIEPGPNKSWLLGYLGTIGISVAWLDRQSGRFWTAGTAPSILADIFENGNKSRSRGRSSATLA